MRRLGGTGAGCINSRIASNTALNWASYFLSSSSIFREAFVSCHQLAQPDESSHDRYIHGDCPDRC
jgi:hypothetical protein